MACFLTSLVVLFIFHFGACREIVGIPPERLSFYDQHKQFICLDGSNTIPFNMVNDDYCDCIDGSDEPGTAACPNGRFYCANEGYKGMTIVSSCINDGICDCCDGSDEYDSSASCSDTCIEMGRHMREEEEKRKLESEQGYVKRQEYTAFGKEQRLEKEKELENLDTELQLLKVEFNNQLEAMEMAKEKAEEAKDKYKKETQEFNPDLMPRDTKVSKGRPIFVGLDEDINGLADKRELQELPELDTDEDGTVSSEEVEEILGRREGLRFNEFIDEVFDRIAMKRFNQSEYEEVYDEGTQFLIDSAEEAKIAFDAIDGKKQDLENKVKEAKKFLEMDFGEDSEYLKLWQNCVEYTDREYTYKLCPFEKVTQRSKSGGRETSLGTWGNWQGTDYSVMKYLGGETCWNGPARSTTVNLVCGTEERILSVSEPNKCEYAMSLAVPLVCKPLDPHLGHEEL